MSPGMNERVLTDVLTETLAEKKRARRWGLLYKGFFVVYLLWITTFIVGGQRAKSEQLAPFMAVITLEGEVGKDIQSGTFIEQLRAVYDESNLKGVLLEIDSPGGLPVEAELIGEEIQRQRQAHPEIPIHAYIKNVGASAAYWIASQTDQIYAASASIIGSIGVVSPRFGYVSLMDKVGVESRMRSAGDKKMFGSPFEPESEDAIEIIDGILAQMHQQFINVVKQGRGDRLSDNPDLFSGRVWLGPEAVTLGLIDGIANREHIQTEIIGVDSTIDFSEMPGFIESLKKDILNTKAMLSSGFQSNMIEAKL